MRKWAGRPPGARHERRDALDELRQRAQTAGDDAIERELLWETELEYATIMLVAVLDDTGSRRSVRRNGPPRTSE